MSTVGAVARSLQEASRLASVREGPGVTSLLLPASEDLVCWNMMCEKLGSACACRLALCLSRLPGLRELDVSWNALGTLPEAVVEQTQVERLDVSGNGLTSLPAGIKGLKGLRELRIADNAFRELPPELAGLACLEDVHVGRNLLAEEDLARLRESLPGVLVVGGAEQKPRPLQ